MTMRPTLHSGVGLCFCRDLIRSLATRRQTTRINERHGRDPHHPDVGDATPENRVGQTQPRRRTDGL